MKALFLSLFITLMSTVSQPCHAQFYTIGTSSQCKPLETKNPSEQPSVTPRDSVAMANMAETEGEKQVPSAASSPLVSLPLKEIKIGSKFGMRMHPIYHKNMMHNGVDLSARYESVYSMFPGTVIKVGQDSRSGKFVTVKTGDYTISYCHLSQQFVKVNDLVNAGTILALSGSTGVSTGPHLHITTKKDGKAFNPTILLEYIERVILNL